MMIAGAVLAGPVTPASASETRSHATSSTSELSAQTTRRPRVTVYPRRTSPGPNAKRHCRAWLVKEYRVSGTVIVPRRQCWWQ
jgi:hypothetical protein